MPAGDIKKAEQDDDEFIPDAARPICTKCLKPCHPLQYYCDNCDSNDAINPLTPYIGFVNIRFNYDIFLTIWRRIFNDGDTPVSARLFYLCLLVMFVPIILVMGLPFWLIFKMPRSVRKTTIIALFIAAIVLLIFFWLGKLVTGLPIRPIVR